ncbi:tail-specific protease precursor (CTP) [Rickettsia prowazekii str. GvV257]|uniref:TAIL-SPECIFIC PROTEASE (Ctp) n=2 Tax=Rickettsia prowazekii TaxID=782 RepID=Q9ZDU6_RICPR|nr:S41 family peptidase [Rickettsia prowazekii]EOB10755.1 Carboxyl-terminal protease [Rickettsia prowazekii str. GvF12]ADE29740.1 Carboxyl-terminal protease [Rickettsia prowazekii str. Rp22]AFE49048.1 tail-specific protease precursor (CTP) [Rickettsia prowazekii str. Chernikova]AFE49894.1 tail-specific protease precursor (CTP) [Rickettsia prowazekii str. Katsinyian]AFE50738.1 tail-specific protease precursor (CTP) [Rickettsia prowazekii str. BuV67-CWPP]
MLLRFIIALFLSINCAIEGKETENKISNQEAYKQFQDVFERIEKDYVQVPDRQKMIDEAINGMLNSLDPHSNYYTDEDLEDIFTFTKGEFGGIGVEIMYDSGAIKIISSIDDLPAFKAGLKGGDYIVGVNDELVSTLGPNKAIKEMRGTPGTKVRLLIIKEEEAKPQELELTREIVKIKPIKAHLEKNNIAYIRITTFNESTISELKAAVKKLKTESKDNLKGIILDLRNNAGGILDQAIAVSDYFIDSGVIVTTKGRTTSSNSETKANEFSLKAPKVPMIVLINGNSASASEIVAGALQDHKRAIILGTKSFGKGSVQALTQINSRAAVKLTISKYYTPSGRSIQAEGIEPDILIEPAKVEYPEVKKIDKRFSESSLKNYLKNDNAKNKDSNKETKTKNNKQEESELSELYKKDYQFARAYDVITGLIINTNLETQGKAK